MPARRCIRMTPERRCSDGVNVWPLREYVYYVTEPGATQLLPTLRLIPGGSCELFTVLHCGHVGDSGRLYSFSESVCVAKDPYGSMFFLYWLWRALAKEHFSHFTSPTTEN